jgi:hypothetical protein
MKTAKFTKPENVNCSSTVLFGGTRVPYISETLQVELPPRLLPAPLRT